MREEGRGFNAEVMESSVQAENTEGKIPHVQDMQPNQRGARTAIYRAAKGIYAATVALMHVLSNQSIHPKEELLLASLLQLTAALKR